MGAQNASGVVRGGGGWCSTPAWVWKDDDAMSVPCSTISRQSPHYHKPACCPRGMFEILPALPARGGGGGVRVVPGSGHATIPRAPKWNRVGSWGMLTQPQPTAAVR